MPFNTKSTNYVTLRDKQVWELVPSVDGKNYSLRYFTGMIKCWVDDRAVRMEFPDYERLLVVESWWSSHEDCTQYNFLFVGEKWNEEMKQSLWESSGLSVKKVKWGKIAAEKQWRGVIEYLVGDTTLKPSERLAIKLWLSKMGVIEVDVAS